MGMTEGWDRNKIIVACVIVAIIGAVLYKKFGGSTPAPFEFRGETYEHIEAVSQNKYVTTHGFSVDGKPMQEADRWIQITLLSPKLTEQQLAPVYDYLRRGLRVTELDGNTSILFGGQPGIAVYVLILDTAILVYAKEDGGQERAVLKAEAAEIIEDMQWIPIEL